MDTSPRQHGYNLFKYVTKEKKDVTNIYFYAILNGLVQLSVPLGIQSIVSFVMGATMATSIYILIAFVVLGTWLVGYFRLKRIHSVADGRLAHKINFPSDTHGSARCRKFYA